MREIAKGITFSVNAMKRNHCMLLTDYGRTILFTPDSYTKEIPIGVWRFWIIKNHKVIKSIPYE
jgi:hypothetical protein